MVPEQLFTERLRLRKIKESDAPFLLRLMNSPSWQKFVNSEQISTVDQASSYIKKRTTSNKKIKGDICFVIEERATNEPIGICGYMKREFLELSDLGFAILPEYQSKGYAREAVERLIRSPFLELGVEEYLAIVSPRNKRSIALIESLQLPYLGVLEIPEYGECEVFGNLISEAISMSEAVSQQAV